jgi:hypothetical protein
MYIFQQITRVLMLDTSGQYFTLRYDPVYAKQLTINKGVDNVLLFEFVNQDEKPVNITGTSFLFRVLNQPGSAILLEQPMVILNGPLGRAKVTLPADMLFDVMGQPASYSIIRSSGNLNQAVFVDAGAGARAPAIITDGVLPQFVPSTPLTIPTTQLESQVSYDGSPYENYPNWAGQYGSSPGWVNYFYQDTEYFSSFIKPRNAVTTIQIYLKGYTGTIKAQWAADYQSIWRNATESKTYLDHTGVIYLNVIGWYPLLRLSFNNSIWATPKPPGYPATAWAVCIDGELDQIILQNGGSGYLAPPCITIIGNGSGASAVAQINDVGTITGFTITNRGSGYWPIPSGGVNAQQVPVPPANQGAIVLITTGYAESLFYR